MIRRCQQFDDDSDFVAVCAALTFGLGNRCLKNTHALQGDVGTVVTDRLQLDAEGVLVLCLASLVEQDPDLATVLDAWPALPAAIRAGIVAMVQAAVR